MSSPARTHGFVDRTSSLTLTGATGGNERGVIFAAMTDAALSPAGALLALAMLQRC